MPSHLTTCSVAACIAPIHSRGWCSTHYSRWRVTGDPLLTKYSNPPTCSVEGCETRAKSRGWCSMHWLRWWKTGDPLRTKYGTADERFFSKVNKNGPVNEHKPELGPCWVWTSPLRKDGYAQFWDGEKLVGAHTYLRGKAGSGMEWDHLCRNRACVGPTEGPPHLERVTTQVNGLRGIGPAAANAAKTHCPKGHPYDRLNTYVDRAKGRTGRKCRQCVLERMKNARVLPVPAATE